MRKLFLAMAMTIVTATVVSAQENTKENRMNVSYVQTDKDNRNDGDSRLRCGIKFRIGLSGVTKIELESVDGNPLAGRANIKVDAQGNAVMEEIGSASAIITFRASDPSGFTPDKDYYISTLPCDLYGGYRLSIYKDGLVADYFGVHQIVKPGTFITPEDLAESELEFEKPDAPLVEKERPKMDAITHQLFIQYRRKPTEANRQALLERMGIRYDKVVARKKNKLRELEREARTYNIVEHMQGIVNEMVENRDIRIQQQFLRFIDPRRDENPEDTWMVLRGASARNAYIGYTPVTNAEYARFNTGFMYDRGKDDYPAVGISIKDAEAYCDWLSTKDSGHNYRLPTEEEWVLAAGHMPKDVSMNSGHAESGLTAVDAYAQSKGACGGIDFWGNCWEWTSSTDNNGLYIIKGGSWDSKRDDCRSEKSDDARNGSQSYANVGFRVIRTDSN